MSSHFYDQPTSFGRPLGHFAKWHFIYTNVPPMSSHVSLKATFPVSQGWLLKAGSTVFMQLSNIISDKLDNERMISRPLKLHMSFTPFQLSISANLQSVLLSSGTTSFSFSRTHAVGFHYEKYGEIRPSRTLSDTLHCSVYILQFQIFVQENTYSIVGYGNIDWSQHWSPHQDLA